MLRTIHLVGKLSRFSKKPVQIDADTTQMVMQGLIAMFGPSFKQMVREGEWHVTRNKKPKECKTLDDSIGEEELAFGLGNTIEIWFAPAVKALSAVVRIVVGVVLIVAGIFFKMPFLVKMGAMLVLGGVSELLAPKPSVGQQSQSGQNPSFLFNGTVNVTEQGGPVPIVYGRVRRASSLVLSAGISTENMTVTDTARGNTTTRGGTYKNGQDFVLEV